MDPERIEQIERFMEDSMSEDEMEQFRLRLRADKDLRTELVSALRLSGLAAAAKNSERWSDEMRELTDSLSWAEDRNGAFERRVMSRLNDVVGNGATRRNAIRFRTVLAPLAAAAVLIVCVGLMLLYWRDAGQTPTGSPPVVGVAATSPMAAGAPIGVRIATAAESKELRFGEGAVVVTVFPDSEVLANERLHGGWILDLYRGEVMVDVVRKGTAFAVRTTAGEARALGTKYKVSLRQNEGGQDMNGFQNIVGTAMVVTVMAGTVEVVAQGEQQGQVVVAGQSVLIAGAGATAIVERASAPTVPDGTNWVGTVSAVSAADKRITLNRKDDNSEAVVTYNDATTVERLIYETTTANPPQPIPTVTVAGKQTVVRISFGGGADGAGKVISQEARYVPAQIEDLKAGVNVKVKAGTNGVATRLTIVPGL